jgi:hypothetical protein
MSDAKASKLRYILPAVLAAGALWVTFMIIVQANELAVQRMEMALRSECEYLTYNVASAHEASSRLKSRGYTVTADDDQSISAAMAAPGILNKLFDIKVGAKIKFVDSRATSFYVYILGVAL